MDHLHVHVCLLILDLLQIVVPNVQSTQNVQVTKHVSMRNAETHVLDLVVSMQSVLLSIILQFALVQNMTLEIRSQTVTQNLHHVRNFASLLVLLLSKPFHYPSVAKEPPRDDPCNPSPCGPNAQCSNGICTCLPEYQGDPYTSCRPECVISNDCPRDKSCVRNKCIDPCPGTCGQNAICDVINHTPMCSCPPGMRGNAFVQCSPYQCMYFDLP
jgi:hypothetical protein